MRRLFDAIDRTDARPGRHGESTFAFFNRVAGIVWERIRTEEEAWYAEYPDEHGDLRERFRSDDDTQHFAAWWELYLHRLFSRLGFEIEVHPTIDGRPDRPDMLLDREGEPILVEAVSFSSGIVEPGRHEAREGQVIDAINAIESDSSKLFFLRVEFDAVGAQTLKQGLVKRRIVQWLDTLAPDADAIHQAFQSDATPPSLLIEHDDWAIDLAAIPVSPEARGRSDHTLFGMGSTIVGDTNDRERLANALDRKRRKYGTPDRPLLIAALSISPTFDGTIAAALFGTEIVQVSNSGEVNRGRRPDGLYIGPDGPRATQLSGVLIGDRLGVTALAEMSPRLWHNPAADHPVSSRLLPLPSAHLIEDRIDYQDGAVAPHEVFGISRDWPGPESAFPKR